jgi:hypothetical protein
MEIVKPRERCNRRGKEDEAECWAVGSDQPRRGQPRRGHVGKQIAMVRRKIALRGSAQPPLNLLPTPRWQQRSDRMWDYAIPRVPSACGVEQREVAAGGGGRALSQYVWGRAHSNACVPQIVKRLALGTFGIVSDVVMCVENG